MDKKKEMDNSKSKIEKYIKLLQNYIEQPNGNATNTLLKLRDFSKNKKNILIIGSSGGLPILLELMQRPNKKIIDICSSILANCLTEGEIRVKVVLPIFKHFVQLSLKSFYHL